MIDDILLCEANQAHITHNVDVRFGGVQRNQFGSFFDARSGSINPCRLTPYVMDRREAVKKKLSDNDGGLRPIPPTARTDHGYR